jgi:hypothetical protein
MPAVCPKPVTDPLLAGRLVTSVRCSASATVAFARKSRVGCHAAVAVGLVTSPLCNR